MREEDAVVVTRLNRLARPIRDLLDVADDAHHTVLGAALTAYDAYEAGAVSEYVPVHGVAAYHKGRAAFLAEMLARPRLFHTDRVMARWMPQGAATCGRHWRR